MKRETILFFLENNKINLYFVKSKREKVVNVDTSLFFKYGEILDVSLCEDALLKVVSKINFGPYYLKPDLCVLYNGIKYYDSKFIYSCVLKVFNYHKIFFVTFKDLIMQTFHNENIIVYHKDYYVWVSKERKLFSERKLNKESIIVGKSTSKYVHYSDENMLWKIYKSCFTNTQNYDMIYIGDDK